MPELPEVEVVRQDLSSSLVGQTIKSVQARDALVLVGLLTPQQFARRLAGRTVQAVRRRGKVLIIELSGGRYLLVHLRMTGKLYPLSTDEPLPGHVRVIFRLSDGRRLIFADPRRFGRLEIADGARLSEAQLLGKMGVDALSPELDERTVGEMLRPHSIAIKQWLLDQTHIAGLGNIYASEVLHRCRIHPDTSAKALEAKQVRALLRAMRRVLAEAIEWRGTTVSDYVTGQGVPGGFQRRLRVYGRAGERCRCRRCAGVIIRTTHAKRSTYYCPQCQSPP